MTSNKNIAIKRYTVVDAWKDWEVSLEVDHDILTVDRATEINEFLTSSKHRLREENGDVVRAVIRLAGVWMINHMLREDGADFNENSNNCGFGNPGPSWSEDLQNEEGWGGAEEGNPYGWCGIRIIAASVQATSFDDVELHLECQS